VERLSDSEPQALFGYVAEALNRFGLAYLHVIEPRVVGS
jgi:N-ethylmaleimide reductase